MPFSDSRRSRRLPPRCTLYGLACLRCPGPLLPLRSNRTQTGQCTACATSALAASPPRVGVQIPAVSFLWTSSLRVFAGHPAAFERTMTWTPLCYRICGDLHWSSSSPAPRVCRASPSPPFALRVRLEFCLRR
ncbi:hypothetical protein BV20DRAFT_393649 [Pilatotrama ljubarskyi]|nr:hypothetical protein BV20DRAFT_393649 [Pilatotrama ljubarskyi]